MTYKEFTIQYALGTIDRDTLYRIAIYTKSKKILSILRQDEDNNVRYCVADNPNCPIDILRVLSKDKDSWVRYWVVRNPNTPIKSIKNIK
jgi:hypothetical protein